ncbi:PREDICTED: PI-actitoxin-Axm2a-like [Rhagoletis zephyria]|uniref:PI-actitoxin-Axm2a-like n=1 Tax=Rhagoletis zephyria TaxID=28612 RepID=UPI0008114944|nr:PREDICTED: PI-actitoxin-Axm2a-like [Rhagoletis zephyria]
MNGLRVLVAILLLSNVFVNIFAVKATSEEVCSQSLIIGPCRGMIPRYYYNADSKSCQGFSYGGCHANGNNFETQEDCEDKCMTG